MPPGAGDAAAPGPRKSSCWGCRVLSGAGLIGAGWWVYLGPRRVMRQRIAPNMWHIAQMTFGLSLACWGIVMIIDPVGKVKK